MTPQPRDGQPLVVTVTGRDRPGITSALLSALRTGEVTVADVEQVVIRGRLVLGVVLQAPRGAQARVRAAAEAAMTPLGLEVEVTAGPEEEAERPRRQRCHVTVLGHPLRPAALGAIAGCVADYGGNIDRIVRIARYPVTAVELEVSGADLAVLRPALSVSAAQHGIDVAVER